MQLFETGPLASVSNYLSNLTNLFSSIEKSINCVFIKHLVLTWSWSVYIHKLPIRGGTV